MSAVRGAVADTLLVAGCGVTVLSSLALLWTRDVLDRLHLLGPVSSLGAPLIGAALIVAGGWELSSIEIAVTVLLLALSGPAVAMATGRVHHQRETGDTGEEPE